MNKTELSKWGAGYWNFTQSAKALWVLRTNRKNKISHHTKQKWGILPHCKIHPTSANPKQIEKTRQRNTQKTARVTASLNLLRKDINLDLNQLIIKLIYNWLSLQNCLKIKAPQGVTKKTAILKVLYKRSWIHESCSKTSSVLICTDGKQCCVFRSVRYTASLCPWGEIRSGECFKYVIMVLMPTDQNIETLRTC